MSTGQLIDQLRNLVISSMRLEGKSPEDIDPSAPLFGAGLGLDSLDALELAMAVEEQFGVRVPEGAEGRMVFGSIQSLAIFIQRMKDSSSTP
jgi:acyl carrier protein